MLAAFSGREWLFTRSATASYVFMQSDLCGVLVEAGRVRTRVAGCAAAPESPLQSEELRPAATVAALDSAGTAHATAVWLQESLQAAGPACAAAAADVLQAHTQGSGGSGRKRHRGEASGESWQAKDMSETLPGVHSGKATAHAMLLRFMMMCRRQGEAGGGEGSAVTAPPRKVLRNLPALLQDMSLCVAEAVAAVYMSDVRNGSLGAGAVWAGAGEGVRGAGDGDMRGSVAGGSVGGEGRVFEEVSVPALLDPRLGTTRELERFRNHVALAATVRRTYGRVRDVYEDRCAHDHADQRTAQKPRNRAALPTTMGPPPAPTNPRTHPRTRAHTHGALTIISAVCMASCVKQPHNIVP